MYLGSWKVDDLLTFYANTTRFDTGVATDADSAPSYRVYEDETGTPLLTGTMALIDSANTAGFYSEQITLSAANGFEKGKCYAIYLAATVNSVAGAAHHTFQVEAEVDANVVSDKTGYAIGTGGITSGSFGAGAVDAAAIAANAIGSSEFADAAALKVWTQQLTEAYAADGVAPTGAQAMFGLLAMLMEFAISGTTLTVKKLDGSTTAMTFTLDDASNPTALTRAT